MMRVAVLVAALCAVSVDAAFVRCETTAGPFTLTTLERTAPKGAKRFLELVEDGFFDGQVFYRAVQKFVLQFGVSPDPETQKKWHDAYIPNDNWGVVPFKRGTLSFAGFEGDETRSCHFFFGMNPKKFGRVKSRLYEIPIAHFSHDFERDQFLANVTWEHGDLSGLQPELVEKGYGVLADLPDPPLTRILSCKRVTPQEAQKLIEAAVAAEAAHKKAVQDAHDAIVRAKEEKEAAHQAVLDRIKRLLEVKAPKQLRKLDKMLEAWEGRELELLQKLETKHKVAREDEL